MHGYTRLILSFFVLLSHLGHHAGQINLGVAGVVMFYILSGFVVTHLCVKHFEGKLAGFYLERFLRIYPLYFVILLVAAAFHLSTGFGSPNITWGNALKNLSIIPLNYFAWDPDPFLTTYQFALIPTGWSLGAELQVYLLLPLIIRYEWAKWLVSITSVTVFSFALLGKIDPNQWGYRLIPGTIFIFLAGAALCKKVRHPEQATRFDRIFPGIAWIWVLCLAGAAAWSNSFMHISISVVVGYLVGYPILAFTSSPKIRLRGDAMAGKLSYGIFLAHCTAIFAYLHFVGADILSLKALAFTVSVSVILAFVGVVTVEKLVWPLRQRLSR